MPVQSSGSAPNHVIREYPFDDLWIHPPNPKMIKTLDLEDHHLRYVFVWTPVFTFPTAFPEGRLPCPRCETTSRVIAKGFTQKESRRDILRNSCCNLLGYFYHGHGCKSNNKGKEKVRLEYNRRSRRCLRWWIHTKERPFGISVALLSCHSTSHQRGPWMLLTWTLFLVFPRQGSTVPESFSSWDAGVLSQLPLLVRESFPFVLTQKSAIHADVLEEITDNLVHAKGFPASRAALEQAHLKDFHARELKYYNMLLWRKQNGLLQPITAVSDFGSFGDPDGYNGFVPSENYLSSVWCDVMKNRPVAKLDKLAQGVESEVRVLVEVATVATESAEKFCSSDPCPKGRVVRDSTFHFIFRNPKRDIRLQLKRCQSWRPCSSLLLT